MWHMTLMEEHSTLLHGEAKKNPCLAPQTIQEMLWDIMEELVFSPSQNYQGTSPARWRGCVVCWMGKVWEDSSVRAWWGSKVPQNIYSSHTKVESQKLSGKTASHVRTVIKFPGKHTTFMHWKKLPLPDLPKMTNTYVQAISVTLVAWEIQPDNLTTTESPREAWRTEEKPSTGQDDNKTGRLGGPSTVCWPGWTHSSVSPLEYITFS